MCCHFFLDNSCENHQKHLSSLVESQKRFSEVKFNFDFPGKTQVDFKIQVTFFAGFSGIIRSVGSK